MKLKKKPAFGSTPTLARSLADLPDELLVRCLQPLSTKEQFESLAPVSKRFNQLCHAPQLLRTITVDADHETAERRAASLLPFLMTHGMHVLSLDLYLPGLSAEVGALVASCLAVCGAVGGRSSMLQELEVNDGTALPTAAWLAGLKSLRRLKLECTDTSLVLPLGLSQLRQLTDAELAGMLDFEHETSLPPALTRLRLDGAHVDVLPAQLSSLAALVTLELWNINPAGFAPIASLPSLRQLSLHRVADMPAGLSMLSQLHRLVICNCDAVPTELWEDLPHLHGLTALCLDDAFVVEDRHVTAVPPAIAQLPRLERLYINCYSAFYDEHHFQYYATPSHLSLPTGPWLRSIRWLGLPWPLLQAGAGMLREAPQLEYLCSVGTPYTRGNRQEWDAFWEVVATHRPLHCLAYAPIGPDHMPEFNVFARDLVDPLLMLHRRCPGLQLHRLDHELAVDLSPHTFPGQMLSCTAIPAGLTS